MRKEGTVPEEVARRGRKPRTPHKTPFMVSIVQNDKSLKVVASGFSDYKAAEKWAKKDSKDDLNLSGTANFFIFHAKKLIEIDFGDKDEKAEKFETLLPDYEEEEKPSQLDDSQVLDVKEIPGRRTGDRPENPEATSPLDTLSNEDNVPAKPALVPDDPVAPAPVAVASNEGTARNRPVPPPPTIPEMDIL